MTTLEIARAPIPLRICLVSDFFLPNLGGVEVAQYQVAQALIQRGHKVIVVSGTYTHAHQNERQGIRYLTNGLKVYYIPVMAMTGHVSFPTILSPFPLLRNIFIRERIQIVHGHQSVSPMAHEAILLANTLGLKTVFTDHSLFALGSLSSIHVNKLLQFTLSDIHHVICVSYILKENVHVRTCVPADKISVIPNAIDTTKFRPDPSKSPDVHQQINIVVLSRLVFRKGIDLLVEVIPSICALFPTVHFIIGGDGPKRIALEEMREQYHLQRQVEMLGEVEVADVPAVLNRGHLFLNCSLTEAFCIAILEAVSCGLFVVSTKVGGIPEVLPPDMIEFAEATADSLVQSLTHVLPRFLPQGSAPHSRSRKRLLDPDFMHRRVTQMYNWHDVAARTEVVYIKALQEPPMSPIERLERFFHASTGVIPGILFAACVALMYMACWVLEWFCPAEGVEMAVDFPTDRFQALIKTMRPTDVAGKMEVEDVEEDAKKEEEEEEEDGEEERPPATTTLITTLKKKHNPHVCPQLHTQIVSDADMTAAQRTVPVPCHPLIVSGQDSAWGWLTQGNR